MKDKLTDEQIDGLFEAIKSIAECVVSDSKDTENECMPSIWLEQKLFKQKIKELGL